MPISFVFYEFEKSSEYFVRCSVVHFVPAGVELTPYSWVGLECLYYNEGSLMIWFALDSQSDCIEWTDHSDSNI